MKNLFLVLVIALLFIGCESDSVTTDGEKRLEIQKLFDQGDAEAVISLLENDPSYQSIYPDEEYKLYLGSAYLVRAGFNLETVVDLITEEDTESATEQSSELNTIDSAMTDLALQIDLFASIKASSLFKDALDISCSDEAQLDFNFNQKEVCLFIGITGLLKTAATLNYIVDIDALLSEDNVSIPPRTLATACALEYAFKSSNDDFNGTCSNGSVLRVDGNVTFSSDNTYKHVTIDVDENNTFSELINFAQPIRSTVLVEGNCSVEYDYCGDIDYDGGCYICPLAQGDIELPSTTEILLEAINEDLAALVAILPEEENVDVNVSDANAVDEFKLEITGGEDRDVTEEDLLDYFNGMTTE